MPSFFICRYWLDAYTRTRAKFGVNVGVSLPTVKATETYADTSIGMALSAREKKLDNFSGEK